MMIWAHPRQIAFFAIDKSQIISQIGPGEDPIAQSNCLPFYTPCDRVLQGRFKPWTSDSQYQTHVNDNKHDPDTIFL